MTRPSIGHLSKICSGCKLCLYDSSQGFYTNQDDEIFVSNQLISGKAQLPDVIVHSDGGKNETFPVWSVLRRCVKPKTWSFDQWTRFDELYSLSDIDVSVHRKFDNGGDE
jgi:hypothetical protein